MAENVVHLRKRRATLLRVIESIPQEAQAGGRAAQAMLTRAGLALLGRIKQAFIVKARGGTDDAGDSWAPLSPRTVAYSRTRSRGRGGRTRTERGRDAFPSQALNARQQARWWDLYRQGLAMSRKGNADTSSSGSNSKKREATSKKRETIKPGRSPQGFSASDKASAAKRAWAILKSEGAKTLLDKYGQRQVEILRDTGLLLNSLSPGVASREQVFRVGRGEVIVGTNRKGAKYHHEGTKRMPQRRLWPSPGKWPIGWWQDITEQIQAGLVDITLQLLRRA